MKGDFSRWNVDKNKNYNGVLHQQGRVLLDSDWNAGTRMLNAWQEQAGRDTIGRGVAAVPAGEPDSFKVEAARVVNGGPDEHVELDIKPGRVWADGLLTYLPGDRPDLEAAVTRTATYLGPPFQDPGDNEANIDGTTRDAVVLEVWQESVNGFQVPGQLLEPALGGPDTTERVHTSMAFRLLRLDGDDTCADAAGRLEEDLSDKGTLIVTLAPPETIAGECPVEEGGGYTGFEHHLYRIEMAKTDGADILFKWSRFNGGLVGRGVFSAGPDKVEIKDNFQAITTSGLTSFYLEAVEYSEELGHWQVTFGTTATLNADNELDLTGAPLFGTMPSSSEAVFFRLWDGIRPISDFPLSPAPAEPVELETGIGIRLEFDDGAAKLYKPGDYWTFKVRAGGIENQELLVGIDNGGTIAGELPHGIVYHRVPLAILNWNAGKDIAEDAIRDCRKRFRPLTQLDGCCTVFVGTGGDFPTIQKAVDFFIGTDGGKICVLPGTYTENVTIGNAENITISGCGERSKVVSEPPTGGATQADAVFHVIDSVNISIQSLTIEADETGTGILLEGESIEVMKEIALVDLTISAAQRSAIEGYNCRFVTIRDCRIRMTNLPGPWPGIFFVGDDADIKNNRIEVISGEHIDPATGETSDDFVGLGGLQVGGTSDRVRIIDNLIQGGIGGGIVLGHILEVDQTEEPVDGTHQPWVDDYKDPCYPCRPGDKSVPPDKDPAETETVTTKISAGALSDILIQGNRIFDMGLDGIGVARFFNLDAADELITVEGLTIRGNEIRNCLNRPLAEIPDELTGCMGYGGIALADVEYLVINDNIIEDNGPDHLDPVCGIYVLHGEGIDIFDNRILNNGAKTDQPAQNARPGPRGGIFIAYAVAPTEEIEIVLLDMEFPRQNGIPAARIHDNIVSTPLGQALCLTALGPVSVVGNQFTSRGMVLKFSSPTFWAASVFIMNLGISNEFYGQLLLFGLRLLVTPIINRLTGAQLDVTGDEFVIPRPGLDDKVLGQYLANGNVLFSNNQCSLDLLEKGLSISISSILILTLDDIGFHNNQCDCSLLDDLILSHSVLLGLSLRVSDNRFKEGLFNALLSAFTFGLMNMTTYNQSTHCIWANGLWGKASPNTVLWPSLIGLLRDGASYCDKFNNLLGDWRG